MYENKCKYCGKSFEKYKSLRRHMSVTHNVSLDQFYVDFYLSGIWPQCKCGCKEKVKWSYSLKGFRDYCQGHQSRVNNNWGHNKVAIEKSAETRRQQYASGERKVWNDGLSMDDLRVKNNIEKSTFAINSDPEELKRRSDLMKCQRKDGTIPTLHGPQHSQWKGGVSEINVLARARVKLYKEWKYPILIRDGFKCVECGSDKKLHVHHDGEQMCDIVSKHIIDEDVKTFEMKEAIVDAVVDYHITNKVSGITLCGKCHENKHPSLNFG